MKKLIDLTGRRFGRLVVMGIGEKTIGGKSRWNCICDCGNRILVRNDILKSGYVNSCGCIKRELKRIQCQKGQMHLIHGKTKSRLYNIWCSMKQRTENSNNKEYKNYGARGIEICKEWESSFESFYKWAVGNGYKDDLTIDRIDNSGNYEPDNCRWVSNKENCNNKRTCHYVTICGDTKTLKQWSEIYKINYSTVQTRIRRGWNEVEALTTPVKK